MSTIHATPKWYQGPRVINNYGEVDPAECIGGGSTIGAGHLKAGLQVIDDNGVFRGVVEVEASLYSKQKGSDILGIFDYNDIIAP